MSVVRSIRRDKRGKREEKIEMGWDGMVITNGDQCKVQVGTRLFEMR